MIKFIILQVLANTILLPSLLCEDFNPPEPTYTFDADGEIPVIQGHGGNIDIPVEDGVLILTRDNFIHVVGPKELILVEFYAPWCGHCKALEPEYVEAAKELEPLGIRLGKVDATQEPELAKDHLVSGYPTIKLFKKGEPVDDYNGGRNAKDIVDYMKQHADPNYKPPPSAVIVLTAANFSKTIKSEPLILVEFYAPWCKHCKNLEPEYEGAAAELVSDNIILAKVNGIEEKSLTDEQGVNGYPALLIFRRGRKFEFNGGRDKNGIIEYMRQQATLPSWEIMTIIEGQNNIARTEASSFAYFTEKNEMYEEYVGAANELRGKLSLLHTFQKDVAAKFSLKPNTITLLMPLIYQSKYEEKMHVFSKVTATHKEMSAWIAAYSVPLVGQKTKGNEEFKYNKKPLVVVYYDVNFSHQYVKDTQFIRNKILPIANMNRDFMFAIANEEEYEDEFKSLGLDESGESVNVGLFDIQYKYPMEPEEDFNSDVLQDFVTAYKDKKLKPHFRSQPVPKKQDSLVKVIVAKNFEKEVMETKKDVLIEFYAPWCGHCKTLDPIYKKLAKHLSKNNPDVVVTKMDATANDVPPLFKVKGFPTIFFLKVTEKDNPIPFIDNDRSFKKLKEFVADEASIFTNIKDEL